MKKSAVLLAALCLCAPAPCYSEPLSGAGLLKNTGIAKPVEVNDEWAWDWEHSRHAQPLPLGLTGGWYSFSYSPNCLARYGWLYPSGCCGCGRRCTGIDAIVEAAERSAANGRERGTGSQPLAGTGNSTSAAVSAGTMENCPRTPKR